MKKTGAVTFCDRVLGFYRTIALPCLPSPRITVIHPHNNAETFEYTKEFFNSFFRDQEKRVFVFGINPGRFGSGITGVPFTDPVALQDICGIRNDFEKRRELSSQFMYQFIERWGGARLFFRQFFLTAVSPIGFLRDGVNCNYYDDPVLLSTLQPFLVSTIRTQLAFGARRDVAIVLGSGKNQKFFIELNEQHRFFRNVYAIEHPRFVMQYRRKNLSDYLEKYRLLFARALS